MRRHLSYATAAFALLALVGFGCSEMVSEPTTDEMTQHPTVGPAAQWEGVPCGETHTVVLYAGQHIDVGGVTVANDDLELCIQIETTGGWVMAETHVAIARALEDIPQTGSGNPQIGHFALSAEHDPGVTQFDHCIFMDEYRYVPGETLFVAVHAVVILLGENGEPLQEETAWADGLEFPGRSWATCFSYTVQECEEPELCTVTPFSPIGGEDVCLFEPFLIMWEDTGQCATEVRIELYENGLFCTDLATAPNIGEYEWLEPFAECGDVGSAYTIRVVLLGDAETVGETDEFFLIDCSGSGE